MKFARSTYLIIDFSNSTMARVHVSQELAVPIVPARNLIQTLFPLENDHTPRSPSPETHISTNWATGVITAA